MKKKELLRKAVGILAATSMVATMSIAAFADDAEVQTDGTQTTSSATVSMLKTIKLVDENIDGGSYISKHCPNVSYTYTITAPTAAELVAAHGEDNSEISLKAGNTAAVNLTTATLSYTSAQSDNDSNDKNPADSLVSRYVEFTFDSSQFTEEGIYRYKVTESDPTGADASLVENTFNATAGGGYVKERYIDVWVIINNGTPEIKGYTVVEKTKDQNDDDIYMKTGGYTETSYDEEGNKDGGTTSQSPDPVTGGNVGEDYRSVSQYTTYDLKVAKNVINSKKSFDFTINLSGLIDTHKVWVNGTETTVSGTSLSTTTTLSNGGTYIIKGLPASAAYTISEALKSGDTNTYSVTATKAEKGGTAAAISPSEATIGGNGNPTSSTISNATAITSTGALTGDTVTVTNTCTSITPTGVILKVIPYVIMVVAGFAIIVFVARRRKA